MIRRYVSRTRGRVLRAAGVPRLPNLPSARSMAQAELRRATRVPRVAGRRASSSADGPDDVEPNRRTDRPRDVPDDPYLDPSRDLGEGPDRLTRTQGVMVLVALAVAVYLFVYACAYDPTPTTPTEHCHSMCQWERENTR